MFNSATIPMPAAADFMTAHVVTVAPDSDIIEAAAVLTRGRCSGAPVVDADGRVLGVLTHECCMRAISGSIFNAEVPGKVDDHMVPDFVTVGPEADLFRVVSTFGEQDRRRVAAFTFGYTAGKLAGRLHLLRRFAPAALLDSGIRKDLRLDAGSAR